MKRLVLMVMAAGTTLAGTAMPTKAELRKAQEMVSDVTAADVAALKAKSKTSAEVAAKHMELAGQAESEAEKYLLLQAAFKLYAKAGDYDAAANVIEKLQAEITDYDPEVTVELCGAEFIRKMRENAPRLYALKENARRIVFYRKQLPIREAAVKKNPKDQQAQRKLAECHAELGDWSKALEAFVKAGDELKKISEGETSGKIPAHELGDFWWDYETKSDTAVYKLHAAELYRKALVDDSFKGLARTRTEQRVKDVEKVAVDLPQVVSCEPTNLPTVSLSRFDFRYAHNLHFHFNPCPTGTTKMATKNISITVTRPFCLGDKPITRREWFAVRGEKGTSWKGGEEAPMTYVTYQEASDFAEKLTVKFRKELPQGYVIRLPTAAEWLVAHQVGMPEDVSDRQAFQLGWFGQGCDGNAGSSNMRLYYKDKNLPIPLVKDIWPEFVAQKINPKNEWKRFSSQFAPVPVGLKPADKLGLFDMMGNCFEMCYDQGKVIQGHEWNNEFMSPVRPYVGQGDKLVDPVDRSGDVPMMVSDYLTPRTNCRDITGVSPLGRTPFLGFRLCVGPDLVAEKKAKPGVAATAAIIRPPDKKFSLAQGINMEMIACPAGSFKMSNAPGGPNGDGTHEVKLTRNYWIATSCVTRAMYGAFDADFDKGETKKEEKKPEDNVTVTERVRAEAFAEWLNKKFASKLPRGYVFRQPTEAEWEYAISRGVFKESYSFEGMLDKVQRVKSKKSRWKHDLSVLKYESTEIDPLRVWPGESVVVARYRRTPRWLIPSGAECFRMVLGPDLIAEKKAKK